MRNSLRRRAARRAISVVTLLAFLQGCTLFDPYVQPDRVYLDRFQGPEPTPGDTIPEGTLRSLQSATDYADALREEYFHAISDQAVLNTTAGLMLIPISAAALYFGIAGPREVLLPLAVAGGATYVSANYLHSQPRELIYASGAGAVTCASQAMSPIRAAIIRLRHTQLWDQTQQANYELLQVRSPSLSPLIIELKTAATSVDMLVRDPGLTSAPVQVAREQVAAANALAKEAADADVVIQNAGDTLFNAVQNIRTSVTSALIAEEPNLTALASTLSSQLPLRAGQIGSQAALQPPAAKPAKNDKDGVNTALMVQQTLDQPLARLTAAQENVRAVVDLVKTGPSKAYLAACGIDIKTAGDNFTVTPEAGASFTKADTVESVELLISGGQSPYDWSWYGLKGDNELVVGPSITYDAGGKGKLVVSEKVATAAKESNYQLNVHDAGQNSMIINVKIGEQKKTTTTGTTASTTTTGTATTGTGTTATATVITGTGTTGTTGTGTTGTGTTGTGTTGTGTTGTGTTGAITTSEQTLDKQLLDTLVVRGCTQPPVNLDDPVAVDTALQKGYDALTAKFPTDFNGLGLTPFAAKLKTDDPGATKFRCN